MIRRKPLRTQRTRSRRSDDVKTFLLGVGCQKGGTTWLHSYLHNLPECDFGFMKEYHVLDVHYPPHLHTFRKQQEERLRMDLQKLENSSIGTEPPAPHEMLASLQSVMFYQDITTYFDYFATLAGRSPTTRVVGDITPSYALLPTQGFQRVRQEMESRGLEVKVLFIMRDPVERLHSAARMDVESIRRKGEVEPPSVEQNFRDKLHQPDHIGRSDYPRTIENVELTFAADQVHYAFHEELFDQTEIRQITDFVGATYQTPDFGKRVHATTRDTELPNELLLAARAQLAPVYDFVSSRFPDVDLAKLWKHA